MLALTILTVVTAVTYLAFSTATTAWKKGLAMSEELQHGDFVLEQLVMGLRSTYYAAGTQCGFTLEDHGDSAYASDEISWVKLGSALVGKDCPFQGSPHRVVFAVAPDEEGETAVGVKAWRLRGQPDDFDPAEEEPVLLCRGITGFNCRARDPEKPDEVAWTDEWRDTNRIPLAVELTLYLPPLDAGEGPVEVKRIVMIPVASLSWGGQPAAGALVSNPAAGGGRRVISRPVATPGGAGAPVRRILPPGGPPLSSPGPVTGGGQ